MLIGFVLIISISFFSISTNCLSYEFSDLVYGYVEIDERIPSKFQYDNDLDVLIVLTCEKVQEGYSTIALIALRTYQPASKFSEGDYSDSHELELVGIEDSQDPSMILDYNPETNRYVSVFFQYNDPNENYNHTVAWFLLLDEEGGLDLVDSSDITSELDQPDPSCPIVDIMISSGIGAVWGVMLGDNCDSNKNQNEYRVFRYNFLDETVQVGSVVSLSSERNEKACLCEYDSQPFLVVEDRIELWKEDLSSTRSNFSISGLTSIRSCGILKQSTYPNYVFTDDGEYIRYTRFYPDESISGFTHTEYEMNAKIDHVSLVSTENQTTVVVFVEEQDFYRRKRLLKADGDNEDGDTKLGSPDALLELSKSDNYFKHASFGWVFQSDENEVPVLKFMVAYASELNRYHVKMLEYSVCPRGSTYSNSSVPVGTCESCIDGFTMYDAESKCHRCGDLGVNAGYPDSSTWNSCIPCPIGTFSNIAILSSEECIKCPPGTYSRNETGQESCLKCPENTYGVNSDTVVMEEACLPCEESHFCPEGSSVQIEIEYYKSDEYWDSYSDLYQLDEDSYEYSDWYVMDWYDFYYYSTGNKIFFTALIIFVSAIVVLSPFICLCCPDFCSLLFLNRCHFNYFSTCDCFYALQHSISDGESPTKKKTCHGGFCSLIAITVASIFLVNSAIGWMFDNYVTTNSLEMYISEEGDFVGIYNVTSRIIGSFENCDHSICEVLVHVDSEYADDMDYEVEVSYSEFEMSMGSYCDCMWSCEECDFSSFFEGDSSLEFKWSTDGRLVSVVNYFITAQHAEYHEITTLGAYSSLYDHGYKSGYVFEENGSIQDVDINIMFYKVEERVYDIYNLIIGMIGLEDFVSSQNVLVESQGVTKETGEAKNEVSFFFHFERSELMFLSEKMPSQSILNFIAQLFSLFGFSISFIGYFFCFCDVCVDNRLWGRLLEGIGGERFKHVKSVVEEIQGKSSSGVSEEELSEIIQRTLTKNLKKMIDENGSKTKEEVEELVSKVFFPKTELSVDSLGKSSSEIESEEKESEENSEDEGEEDVELESELSLEDEKEEDSDSSLQDEIEESASDLTEG